MQLTGLDKKITRISSPLIVIQLLFCTIAHKEQYRRAVILFIN